MDNLLKRMKKMTGGNEKMSMSSLEVCNGVDANDRVDCRVISRSVLSRFETELDDDVPSMEICGKLEVQGIVKFSDGSAE
jgi:hypothetical protein